MNVRTGCAYDEPRHKQSKLSTEDVLEHLLSNQEAMPEFLEPLLDHLERKMNAMTYLPQPIDTANIPEMATYDAKDLVSAGSQARIVLNDQTYYLRITRAGKLILTK